MTDSQLDTYLAELIKRGEDWAPTENFTQLYEEYDRRERAKEIQ
jgi:hypothetical protein